MVMWLCLLFCSVRCCCSHCGATLPRPASTCLQAKEWVCCELKQNIHDMWWVPLHLPSAAVLRAVR